MLFLAVLMLKTAQKQGSSRFKQLINNYFERFQHPQGSAR